MLLVAALLPDPARAQTSIEWGEFKLHTNGLIYSEADIQILRRIVDSLNLRFKTCDLSRPYYSNPQARAWYVLFHSKDPRLPAIKKDIDNQVSFQELVQKYSTVIKHIDTNLLYVRSASTDKKGNHYYLQGTPYSGYNYSHSVFQKYTERGNWRYKYVPAGKKNAAHSLEAWYFPEEFKQKRLPTKYAALIQYVDCMIDTTASIFLPSAKRPRWAEYPHSVRKVVDYINKKMGHKGNRDARYTLLYSDSQFNYAIAKLQNDKNLLFLLNEAVEDCLETNTGSESLERLVAALISKEKALEMKRNRIVVGQCSMDFSPRDHARTIAMLAAETHSWDIFLRAHLDIMNDNFARMSDGSYAYGLRKTYLQELEALNLNVVDLLFGLTLRADNLAENHYYGSVWRLGWALTESKERKTFEARALEMLKDPGLDEFNRGLIFILYASYVSRLDKKEAMALIGQLKQDEKSYPLSLRPAIQKLQN